MPVESTEQKKKREEEEAKAKLESQDPGSGTGTGDPEPEPEFEYSDPALKGKSKEEIEALFRMSQQLVTGQNKKLSALEGKVRNLEAEPKAPATPEKKEDFFTDPDGAMDRLTTRLVETIAPLRDEIKVARQDLASQGLEERMAAEFDDWHEVRPWINQLLEQQNFPNPNDEGLLKTLYFTAVGMRHKQGITSKPKGEPTVPSQDPHRGPIPQHRSSPPPPPPAKPAESGEVSWDDLDETERAMCKFHKLTPSTFREWQNANAEDVAESTIGIETKGA